MAGAVSRCKHLPQALTLLLACAAVFVAGYQLTLRHALRQPDLPSSAVFWDAWVPFWPASIVAYGSINLAYVLAFLLTREAAQLHLLSARVLLAQLLSFGCFWLWPLRTSRAWPPIPSTWSPWFEALASFDGASNLVPSLHVALLGILWHHFRSFASTRWHVASLNAWALCVLVSALTTWQHHLADVLAGALLSAALLGLIGTPGNALTRWRRMQRCPRGN